MSGLTKLLTAGMVALSLSACTPKNQSSLPEKNYEPLPKSAFDNHISLVLADNPQEFKQDTADFRFPGKYHNLAIEDKGLFTKITITQKDGSKDYIHVVKKEDFPAMAQVMQSKGLRYDIIQPRGHGVKMNGLYNLVNEYPEILQKNNVFWLAGCSSYDLAKKLSKPNSPVIGADGMNETSRNNHYFKNFLNKFEQSNSWNMLNVQMKELYSGNSAFTHFFPHRTQKK